jgi:tRNA 5-methylaminomethyl-2-thiouridine biosynthesis bifunctional protein
MSDLLARHGLPQRWQGRDRFVVLDTGFGLGERFLAALQMWRDDPRRCERLVFIALQPHPLAAADLHPTLRRAWQPQTPDLHRLGFEGGRVELLLAQGEAASWLRELVAQVDAFCVRAEMSIDALRLGKALGRLAAPGATLAAEAPTDTLRKHLTSVGFEVGDTLSRFAPAFVPRGVASRGRGRHAGDKHALIIGAGLAGCASAWALAEQGWRSTLLERQPQIAAGASGNPAGLFHGIVNAQDGMHARFNRAAGLAAQNAVRAALDRGVAGSANGLLRRETSLDAAGMRNMLRRLGLPPEYVQALDVTEASERAGIALSQPCWWYPGGGWVDPAGLAQTFLDRAGASAQPQRGVAAHRLERTANAWRVLDVNGEPIAEAATVVLANAGDALRLLGAPDWPIEQIRGQISIAPAARLASAAVPIAGSGYLLPAFDGAVMFGATAQAGDDDPSVRDADHALNLAQLEGLLGHPVGLKPADLGGRTAWRCSAADRLPVIGAVPDPAAPGARLDQPRFVPRLPGLYVFTALGSRGITWSTLGAQVLASCVSGAPAPIAASLLDAIDPARFVSRAVRARRAAHRLPEDSA